MSTHNICFLGEIRRLASRLFSYLGLIEEPNTRVHCFSSFVCLLDNYISYWATERMQKCLS